MSNKFVVFIEMSDYCWLFFLFVVTTRIPEMFEFQVHVISSPRIPLSRRREVSLTQRGQASAETTVQWCLSADRAVVSECRPPGRPPIVPHAFKENTN